MRINITNIPKDKFLKIQEEIFRVIIENELLDVDTVTVRDALSQEFLGNEFKIKIDKSRRRAVTTSSVCG